MQRSTVSESCVIIYYIHIVFVHECLRFESLNPRYVLNQGQIMPSPLMV